ncbi:MAG: hypothetical protein LBL34_04255 [Clostridiales bacterium]|jgi:vacuolar-type H+-ATPase subunit H|nr:hypothetical protein [Clostridiales bacterium]
MQSIIDEVTAAERKAAEIIKNARTAAEGRVEQASKDALFQIKELEERRQQIEDEIMLKAENDVEGQMKAIEKKMKKEIEEIKVAAQKNIKTAIDIIEQNLLNGKENI